MTTSHLRAIHTTAIPRLGSAVWFRVLQAFPPTDSSQCEGWDLIKINYTSFRGTDDLLSSLQAHARHVGKANDEATLSLSQEHRVFSSCGTSRVSLCETLDTLVELT